MPRVKRGATTTKKRRRVLRETKGYRWGRKSKKRLAREALLHAWTYQFRDRRRKKRDFRKLWQAKINAGGRANGISYSALMHALKVKHISLNRKMLAELAEHEPETFKQIVAYAAQSGESNAAGDAADDPQQ